MNDETKKILKRQGIYMLVVAILVTCGLISYAVLNFSVLFEGTKTNKIQSCKLSLNLKDDKAIRLIGTVPMTYDEALKYEPYTFTITNNGGCDLAYYKISLVDICNTCIKTDGNCSINGQQLNCDGAYKIDDAKIHYQLANNVTTEVISDLSPNSMNITRLLTINEDITYELRLWIDESATNEDLYVYENGAPKVNADSSIVTKNRGYQLNVVGQDVPFDNTN